MLKRSALSLVMATAVTLFGGCAGYHLGPVVPKSMEGVKTVAVPTFENNTLIPRLEVLAAGTLIKQLQQDGTFQIVNENQADAVIEGRIANISRKSSRSIRGDVIASREYTLEVIVEYQVIRRSTGERLESGTVSGKTSFFVSGNDVNQDERQAIPLALEDVAVALTSRLTEGW